MDVATPFGRDVTRLLAVVSVSICMVPAGAHLFEMLNKLALPSAEYMIVQKIYAGWALFGFAIVAALVCILVHTFMVWHVPAARWLSVAAFLSIVITQVIFWTFTYPVNALTMQWTASPADLDSARLQWELSHAVGAGFMLLAQIMIVAAVISGCRGEAGSGN